MIAEQPWLNQPCVDVSHSHSLFTEVADGLPVVLVDAEPLAVSRTDVDVDGTKVIVLLMTCSKRQQ